MSWSEAVLDIAERMDAEAKAYAEGDGWGVETTLKNFARELRIVVKAADAPPSGLLIPPVVGNRHKEDRLEADLKELSDREEMTGELMTEVADGPLAGDYVNRPVEMPVGAKTCLGGSVYQLGEDLRLHHVRPG